MFQKPFLPNLTLLLSRLVLLVQLNIDEVDLPMEKRYRFCVCLFFSFVTDRVHVERCKSAANVDLIQL